MIRKGLRVNRQVTWLVLFMAMLLLSACGHALNPQAKVLLQQAKGETGVHTALTLIGMMQTSLGQAKSEIGESSGLTTLHDQFHALKHAFCEATELQMKSAAYDEAVTIQKEMKTVFHRLWEYKGDPARRNLHLNLLDNRLTELRHALQSI